jgi:hypothetical protein
MHAARGSQPQEMASATGLPETRDEAGQCGRRPDAAIGYRVVDARQVLHNHAPGTYIEMSDFGIPHLTRRQADVLARRLQQRMWAGAPKFVEVGRARLADGIVGRVLTPTPAVQPTIPIPATGYPAPAIAPSNISMRPFPHSGRIRREYPGPTSGCGFPAGACRK